MNKTTPRHIIIKLLKTSEEEKMLKTVRGNKSQRGGFPGDAVVKNPPANAGDTGSSPGPGRSHMPWSS